MTKLTQEELTTMQELNRGGQNAIQELGQIEYSFISLEQRREKAKQFIANLQKQEQEFIQEITTKYGNGSIDPNTGEFTPADTEQTDGE